MKMNKKELELNDYIMVGIILGVVLGSIYILIATISDNYINKQDLGIRLCNAEGLDLSYVNKSDNPETDLKIICKNKQEQQQYESIRDGYLIKETDKKYWEETEIINSQVITVQLPVVSGRLS